MTIEERLRGLILSRYPSAKDFAAEAGINYSTLLSVFKRGLDNTGISNVQKICDTLGITIEGLCQDRIEFIKKNPDRSGTLREYQNKLLLLMLDQKIDLDGVPLSEEEARVLDEQITAAVDIVRRRRDRESRS